MPVSPALKAEAAPTNMQEELSAAKMVADFGRDGFRLRAPALPSELFRYQQRVAVGLCLDPIIRPDDELYIDATDTTVEHGDLVMIEWTPEIIQAWNSGNKRAAWEAKFGAGNNMSRGIKLRWQFPRSKLEEFRSWYWVCRDGISREGTAKPLGRVVAIVRAGKYLSGDIVHRTVSLASIDPNAVSQMVSLFDLNGTGAAMAPGSPLSNAILKTVAISTIGSPVAVDLSCADEILAFGSGMTAWNFSLTMQRDGTAIPTAPTIEWDSNDPGIPWTAGGGNIKVPFAFTFVDGSVPAGTHAYQLVATGSSTGGSSGLLANCWGLSIKLREIKK